MSFPVKAVVFDWAGTMVDFGCMAPVAALVSVFAGAGVLLLPEEARADMGRAKLDHLRAVLARPGVAQRWRQAHGRAPEETDVAALYDRLQGAMREAAASATALVPGAAQVVRNLRALGIRIGSGTGYTREMMAPILPAAVAQGYAPDVVICAGETPSGRPSPQMTWAALIQMDIWPARACIKVDDAPVGIIEGREAGCWTVGLAASGNEMGLSHADYLALPEEERFARLERARATLLDAGADFVSDDVSGLLPIVHEIAARLQADRQG